MAQILTQVEAILKDKYQPALASQISYAPSPFLEKIRRVPLTNNTIKLAAPIGINGGFGFGEEGLGTPKAGAQKYVEFSLDAVDMYVDIQISNKTVQLASSNTAAMLNALDGEIRGSYASAEWNLSRAIFGNGTGVLCGVTDTITDNEDGTKTMTVTSTKYLVEGLSIDFYTYPTSVAVVASLKAENKGLRIVSIDRENNEITVEGAPAIVAASSANITYGGSEAIYGYITVQNSFKRELCGIGSIMDTAASELYGVNRSKNNWINPSVIDCTDGISDAVLYNGIKKAKEYKGAKIDMILMGDTAFSAYQDYMRANNVTVVDKQKFVGGAVGYVVLVGSQETVIVNERFVPDNEAWGVDTESFILECTPWEFMSKDGAVFVPIAGTSVFRALLASYGNLVCTNPGGCVKFTNITHAFGTGDYYPEI